MFFSEKELFYIFGSFYIKYICFYSFLEVFVVDQSRVHQTLSYVFEIHPNMQHASTHEG